MKKNRMFIFCTIPILCIIIVFCLKLTILQPKTGPDSLPDSDGYIHYLKCIDDKVYFIHSLFNTDEDILYCYDDDIGLQKLDTDENSQIIENMKTESEKNIIRTNDAGMECVKETLGYVLTNVEEIYSDAQYRYVAQESNLKAFPYDKYQLSDYYYGLVDEYAVGLMLATENAEEKYDENNDNEDDIIVSSSYGGYIALVDKDGNVSVIPDYIVQYMAGFVYCYDNCIYFWGYPEINDGETEECRLYAYIVDTGQVRKLCDYGNLCNASDLDKENFDQWSSGDEEEVFINDGYLYSYSVNGNTDIVRFRLTYDENGYPVKCQYDTCIYENPYLR